MSAQTTVEAKGLRPVFDREPEFDFDSAMVLGKVSLYDGCLVDGARNSGKTRLLDEVATKARELLGVKVVSIDGNQIPGLRASEVVKARKEVEGTGVNGIVIVDHLDNLLMRGERVAANLKRASILKALEGRRVIAATDGRADGREERHQMFTPEQRHDFIVQ